MSLEDWEEGRKRRFEQIRERIAFLNDLKFKVKRK